MKRCLLPPLLLLCLCLSGLSQTNLPSSVTLAWDPSPGTNVITNYKVYLGTSSRTYTNSVSAGTNLTLTVTNLLRGFRYYFAATATAVTGLESDYSTEVNTAIPAVPPPPSNLRITLTQ